VYELECGIRNPECEMVPGPKGSEHATTRDVRRTAERLQVRASLRPLTYMARRATKKGVPESQLPAVSETLLAANGSSANR
jgi:hypothetical protein